jgi:hypothetical protein
MESGIYADIEMDWPVFPQRPARKWKSRTMKKRNMLVLLGFAAMSAAGCSSSSYFKSLAADDRDSAGPALENRTPARYTLGAGDALGRAVFTQYSQSAAEKSQAYAQR